MLRGGLGGTLFIMTLGCGMGPPAAEIVKTPDLPSTSAAPSAKRSPTQPQNPTVGPTARRPLPTAATLPTGMVLVGAGSFWMGCAPTDRSCRACETPRHQIYLDGFYLDKNEVTVTDYQRCVSNEGPCTPPEAYDAAHSWKKYCNWGRSRGGDHPINCVTWHQAKAYCSWTGKRLPTEAEWEKASRGTEERIYPWGMHSPSNRACWKRQDSGLGTCPVGSYPEGGSAYGALDMAGNVYEWLSDWYGQRYYLVSSARNPKGPATGRTRVVRGGSWSSFNAWFLRISYRVTYPPLVGRNYIGFRCARSTG